MRGKHTSMRGLILVILIMPSVTPAQAPAPPGDLSGQGDASIELTSAAKDAITRANRYLAESQLPSGAWTYSDKGPNSGVSALAMLAFLASGNVPEQGQYAETIERGLNWILANAQPSGLILYAEGASHGPMYEHAAATLLLSELYGMSDRPEIPTAIQAAVRVIVNAQNEEGGWRYQPHARDADISVTVMQILALRGAQHAGMVVPTETVENAIKYVKRCSDRSGGFLYQTGSGDPNYPRTGAGVASLEVCGEYESDEVRRGLEYLINNISETTDMEYYYYGVYYSAQAIYQARDPARWKQWFPKIQQQLIGQQEPDGSWHSNHGSSYATAMSILALAIPYRYLPIYQR